ncbi:WD40-repeat-containing domain protein [Kalaharituber pfeilii]|nr:WD40-repeat-containing domain protein [Kalaharituber pfeilii]
MASKIFKLSATLKGHEDDVRAVLFPSQDLIISSSRDCSVRLWSRDGPNNTFTQSVNSAGSGFINSLAWIPPNLEHPKGLVISGGHETIIEAREPLGLLKQEADYLMLGHSHNVCALDAYGGIVVSGSWDCKARVWSRRNWETIHILEGHKGSVWAVLALDDHLILTGSADKSIRMWRDGKLWKVLDKHTDCVRGLCRLPYGGFASCGNDATIRIWSNDGFQLQELHGHTSFIYSIAALSNGEIVSSGEDRTVRVWKDGKCIQTMTHPAISVWAVAVCQESGDIVSGASDRIARVFSRDPKRWADEATLREFDEAVASSSIPKNQVGDINKEKLPGPEGLEIPGSKDGQVKMIRNGDIVEAHVWSALTSSWTSVGTVVDAVGSSRKKEFEGKEYDYVFDVDIQEGAPPLQLPYNANQNPFEAATKFLERNKLSMGYLDTVANFIIKNTQGTTIGQQQSPTAPAIDPYGVENRYRLGEDLSAPKKQKFLPQKSYLQITQANLSLIRKKFFELNDEFLNQGNKDICLNPDELEIVANLIQDLEAKKGLAAMSKSTLAAMPTLTRVINNWGPNERLPALDLLRLAAAASPIPTTYQPTQDPSATIIDILEQARVFDKSQPNNVMLGTRVFVNIFETSKAREFAEKHYHKISQLVHTAADGTTNKNLRVAVATLALNYAVLFTSKNDVELARSLFPYLINTLKSENDSETLFRAMVAAGTLVYMGGDVKTTAVRTHLIRRAIDLAVGRVKEARIADIGAEISALL